MDIGAHRLIKSKKKGLCMGSNGKSTRFMQQGGDVFAELRLYADQSGDRDVVERLGDRGVAEGLLSQMVRKPSLLPDRAALSWQHGRASVPPDMSDLVAPWRCLTWNVNQVHQP